MVLQQGCMVCSRSPLDAWASAEWSTLTGYAVGVCRPCWGAARTHLAQALLHTCLAQVCSCACHGQTVLARYCRVCECHAVLESIGATHERVEHR